ncbi:APC family permease [Leifsonia shinshuensis]|uniref:Amino acid transporter n=1 Tax=Leifsonia shinshuensis TaxID=150026 RepID=A0A853CV57_9MICO|nr:APC family permease [Leifsonia shinshuensis]NYJ24298.1 amino acid transporter [Leifsonia shinshuensis]
MTSTNSSATDEAGRKGLKSGALGLVSGVVVGVASTAPAYSLAASLGFIVVGGTLAAGVKAPGIVLLAFIPMYFIAVAYQELNKAEPDCGTTFTWAARAFGPITGWMGGWGIIIADVIVMSNLAQIAGQYSYTFVGGFGLPGVAALANNNVAVTIAGLVWIALMTWICYRGIEVSARLQYFLLGFEVVILIFFAVFALVKVYTGNAEPYSLIPQWSWFNPFTLDFGQTIAPALLTAIFIYWGWDTAVSINEETKNPDKTPGRAAIISTLLLLGTYAIVTVATVAFAGVGTKGIGLANPANSGDVFSAIGPTLFGSGPIGAILMTLLGFSILTSASASTQTTILPTARTTLSMAVYKAIPEKFARIHPRFLTPTWSTIGMGLVSAAFYLIFTAINVTLLTALIGSIGLMIAFYYGLTGFACVWYYHRTLFTSFRHAIMRGLFPLLGGLMLLAVFIYGVIQFARVDWLQDANGKNVTIFGIGAEAVVGVGGILIGVVLMIVWRIIRPDYFKGRTLPRQSDDIILEPVLVGDELPFGTAAARIPATVIAPDFSNLPEGQTAINAETLEEVDEPSDLPPADPDLPRKGSE